MKLAEIKSEISDFSGNISAAHNFLHRLNGVCPVEGGQPFIDLDFNFESTSSMSKFTNLVRNLISRELIQKPIKSGRSLILGEREILQIIVVRKYLSAGCSMHSMSRYLLEMETDAIYERLFAEQLPDIEKIIREASKREERHDVTYSEAPQSTRDTYMLMQNKLSLSSDNLFYQVEVADGLSLHVKKGKFKKPIIEKMIKDLQKYL